MTSHLGYIHQCDLLTVDVHLGLQAKVVLVRFLHCTVTSSSLSILYSVQRSQDAQATLRSGDFCANSLRADYFLRSLGILLHEIFVFSPFIYLLSHLFVPSWTHGYLYYTLHLTQHYITSFAHFFPALTTWDFFN